MKSLFSEKRYTKARRMNPNIDKIHITAIKAAFNMREEPTANIISVILTNRGIQTMGQKIPIIFVKITLLNKTEVNRRGVILCCLHRIKQTKNNHQNRKENNNATKDEKI